jgi:hypothetical protein
MPYEETNLLEERTTNTAPVREKRRFLRVGKIAPAFWTVASILSLIINVILIVALISLGRQLFSLKKLVEVQVLGGLYQNFVDMDKAHIKTTIPISTNVPAKFDLPLKTNTTVTLTEDTKLINATIYELNAGAVFISRANTNIILPAGTRLPIALDLSVPVDQQIPVNLMVDVDIPLSQTELHKPFTGLQEVVKPYYTLLNQMPDSWQEALCGQQPTGLCPQIIQ